MDSQLDFQSKASALLQLLDNLHTLNYQFTAITPLSHERVNNRPDNQWARTLRDIFGWNRPFRRDAIPDDIFEILQAGKLVTPFWDGWRSDIRVSSLNGQLFVHSAFPTVDSDAIFFGPDTYRFMKAVNEHIDNHKQPIKRAADIGCGTGVGAILLGLRFPEAEILALDINEQAVAAATVNARAAKVENVTCIYSDCLQQVEGDFDIIIANPPYLIDGAYRTYRHGGGAHGEEVSLAIVDESIGRLAAGGSLLLYSGVAIVEGIDLFRDEIEKRLDKSRFQISYIELDPDIFGEELQRDCYWDVDRIACIFLAVTRMPE